MTKTPLTVAIFAGSSTPKDAAVMSAATELGTSLGAQGIDIVYGGGTGGVMGAVAEAAAKAGSHVTAIVLEKYADEAQIPGAAQIHVTTEQERFALLTTHNNPAACIALPGGPGSLREALQGLEKAVYEDGAPVLLLDVGTYLSGIRQYFESAVTGGLIRADRANKLQSITPDTDIRAALAPAVPPKPAQRKTPSP